MCKIIVLILFTSMVFCSGLHRDQVSNSEDKSDPQEDIDKYELESRQDFDRTAEKEKELRLLRKAKKMKENNYRRALESILPAKNTESYRRLFEDLINNSDEKSKLTKKEAEEVVLPETRDEDDGNEENISDSQVEEIEVVIERISDDDNENDTNKTANEPPLTQESKSYNSGSPQVTLPENPTTEVPIEKVGQEQPSQNANTDVDMKDRTGQDSSISGDQLEERTVLEPYPISRISEVVIPHYRTTLTRSGVVVSPAVYTVQTSAPVIDHVTTRSFLSNRRFVPDIYGRLTNNNIGHSNVNMKLIEDYNDYGANAYSYAPTLIPARQIDKKMEVLSKLTEGSIKPHLGIINPYRENFYPGYSQPHRYYPDGYRPLLRISR